MKKASLFIAVLITILAGCSKPERFILTGKITNAEGKMVYLEELKVSKINPLDSVKINKNGEFTFRYHVGMPTFFLLRLSEDNFVTLLVDSAEQVTIKADALNFAREYSIEGSPGSALVQELNSRLNRTKQKLDSVSLLYTYYAERSNYQELKSQLDAAYNDIVEEQVAFSTNFVQENPFSMASVLALYQKFDDESYVVRDLQSLRVAASALNAFYPESEHVKALYQNTLQLLAQERTAEISRLIDESGSNSPEIVLPDANDREVALSSLQGKYVLLQFWSALDQNSRIMNPVLVEAYQKYRNRGFEIYQVSVDVNRQEWLDAIEDDRLSWVNVGDMNGSTLALLHYNIQRIPSNYLLDRDGRIIARDLFGPALDRALTAVFNP